MATFDDQIRRQNPWWADPGRIAADPHLKAYDSQTVAWDPPAMDAIPVRYGDTTSLRGPRQVGKTTTAKRLLARLVETGVRRVLYLSCDLLGGYQDLIGILERAREIHPEPDGPWHLFLDEVSSVKDWQRAIKWAWDQGLTRGDFILLTGSSARDVRAGTERLPGRRGQGADFLQLPMSFRDFCVVAERISLPEAIGIDDLASRGGRSALNAAYAIFPTLERALQAYMTVGGYPAAVQDHLASPASVRAETVRMLWDVIAGDVGAARYDKAGALKLLEEVSVSLGAPLTWSHSSKAMGLSDPEAARNYTERLAENFVLLSVYFWDVSGSFAPRKQRKVYFMDPLFAAIPLEFSPGARRPDVDGLVENMVAIALYRSAATSLVQAEPEPGSLGYWKSSNGRELDFVVPSKASRRFAVEVKGDSDSRLAHAKSAITRSFKRGAVISRSKYTWDAEVPVIPAAVLLAVLNERPRREIIAAAEADGISAGVRLIGGSLDTVAEGDK